MGKADQGECERRIRPRRQSARVRRKPKQTEQHQSETRALIAILEEKRAEVMAKDQAGYFIHDWQELRDQVRRMIIQDPRYLAIKAHGVPATHSIGEFRKH